MASQRSHTIATGHATKYPSCRMRLSFRCSNPARNARFDTEQRNSPVSREVVFNQRFFERLAREVDVARTYRSPPMDDGSEYNAEDVERERRLRLGVTPSSRFLNVGVDNQVTWPREEMLIEFDRSRFVLMPKTREHVQSIHVDLHANRLSTEEAVTVINRFLSLLTWCDDQYTSRTRRLVG